MNSIREINEKFKRELLLSENESEELLATQDALENLLTFLQRFDSRKDDKDETMNLETENSENLK